MPVEVPVCLCFSFEGKRKNICMGPEEEKQLKNGILFTVSGLGKMHRIHKMATLSFLVYKYRVL